jgi:hypothetical protein
MRSPSWSRQHSPILRRSVGSSPASIVMAGARHPLGGALRHPLGGALRRQGIEPTDRSASLPQSLLPGQHHARPQSILVPTVAAWPLIEGGRGFDHTVHPPDSSPLVISMIGPFHGGEGGSSNGAMGDKSTYQFTGATVGCPRSAAILSLRSAAKCRGGKPRARCDSASLQASGEDLAVL